MSDAPQSEQLVTLALEMFTVGQSAEGDAFAIDVSEPGIALPLRGKGGFRSALAALYRANHRKPPSASALADAMTVLDGIAQDRPRVPVSLRFARSGDALVVDLGNEDNARCVVIEPGAWHLADHPPAGVVFRRTALTGALPEPSAPGTGDLAPLYEATNLPADDEALVSAWMVAALDPDIPHAPLALVAQQGAAKTTTARAIVRTVDPSPAPLRSAPRSVEEWSVVAAGSPVVALDNVSGLGDWLQDAICRAATGDGMARRELYTDSGLSVLAFRRCVILTGIDLGSLRGDLADRTLMVHPDAIDPSARRLDTEVEAAFTAAWPTVTAGLYDLAAQVLEVLPSVRLVNPPRMADFARYVAAVDIVTGSIGLARYAEHARDLTDEVLEADTVAGAVRAFMADRRAWTGTATDLLAALAAPSPTPKSWPTTPHYLSARLRRATPALATVGIRVTIGHRTATNRPGITLVCAADDAEFPGLSASSNDADDADSPSLSVEVKKREEERAPKTASPASSASSVDPDDLEPPTVHPDDEPPDDVPDHRLDQAPVPERIPDHVLARWELEDTAPDDEAA